MLIRASTWPGSTRTKHALPAGKLLHTRTQCCSRLLKHFQNNRAFALAAAELKHNGMRCSNVSTRRNTQVQCAQFLINYVPFQYLRVEERGEVTVPGEKLSKLFHLGVSRSTPTSSPVLSPGLLRVFVFPAVSTRAARCVDIFAWARFNRRAVYIRRSGMRLNAEWRVYVVLEAVSVGPLGWSREGFLVNFHFPTWTCTDRSLSSV